MGYNDISQNRHRLIRCPGKLINVMDPAKVSELNKPKSRNRAKTERKKEKSSCIDVISCKNNPLLKLNVLSVKNVPGKYSPELFHL